MERDSPETTSRRIKTLVVLALAILANGAGNLSLSYGMKSVGPPEAWTLPGFWAVVGTALSSAPVIAGGLLLLVFFALFLSLLSWADQLRPADDLVLLRRECAAGTPRARRADLPLRWAGVALVSIGVLLVGRTGPSSDASKSPAP